MRKNIQKIFLKSLTLFSIFFILANSNFSSGFFSSSNYTLSQGISMLISPYKIVHNDIVWHSSNPSIANVNSCGVVNANSQGITTITASYRGKKYSCTINVTDPEAVRHVYTHSPKENESFYVYAVTPSNVSEVKFEIEGPSYYKEFYSNNKTNMSNMFLWKVYVPPLKKGTYKIKVTSKMNNSWKSSRFGTISLAIPQNEDKNSCSTSKKYLSREGAEFISRKEGFKPTPYVDVAKYLTIGMGKLIFPYTTFYNNMTKEEGFQEIYNTINNKGISLEVNNFLMKNGISFNQHQFDALVSFTYNLGKTWLYKSNLKNIILESFGRGNQGTVTSSNGIYLRQGPSTSHKRIASLYFNSNVTLLSQEKQNGNWYHVRSSSGKEGYCCSDYIRVHSTNGRNLNSINKSRFANEFIKYHHAGGKCFRGLLKRRVEELEVFFNNNYTKAVPINKYSIPSCMR